jgi:hypothetical protein
MGRAFKGDTMNLKELREQIAKYIFHEVHPITDIFPDYWGITGTMDDESWRRFERHCFYSADKILALVQPAIDEAVKKATKIYKQVLEDDATDLWKITNELKKEIKRHEWICEGRGCYAYDDDQYRQETRLAFDALLELIKNVQQPASNRFHKIIGDAHKQQSLDKEAK